MKLDNNKINDNIDLNLEQHLDKNFNYIFLKSNFIKKFEFDFNNFPLKTISNIFDSLEKYKKNTWRQIIENKNSNSFHSISEIRIKHVCKYFYQKIMDEQRVYQIRINNIERIFFFIDEKGVCCPIGYDKFHFLYSMKTNPKKVNINKIKHLIYTNLRLLTTNEESENIKNTLILNESNQDQVKNIMSQLKSKIRKCQKMFNENWTNIYKQLPQQIQNILDCKK